MLGGRCNAPAVTPRGKIRSLKHPSPGPRGEGGAADRRLRAPPSPVGGQWVLPAYPVDKSADFPPGSGYPQLSTGQSPPFPQGFRPINILLKQIDNLVLHEIQHYHHHKAFDLFPDLKLCRPHADVPKGDLSECRRIPEREPSTGTSSAWTGRRSTSGRADSNFVAAGFHVKPCVNCKAKRSPALPGLCSTWNCAPQRRKGMTTCRDFSLLASRTRAEELESRNWMTMCSSRSADSASSR